MSKQDILFRWRNNLFTKEETEYIINEYPAQYDDEDIFLALIMKIEVNTCFQYIEKVISCSKDLNILNFWCKLFCQQIKMSDFAAISMEWLELYLKNPNIKQSMFDSISGIKISDPEKREKVFSLLSKYDKTLKKMTKENYKKILELTLSKNEPGNNLHLKSVIDDCVYRIQAKDEFSDIALEFLNKHVLYHSNLTDEMLNRIRPYVENSKANVVTMPNGQSGMVCVRCNEFDPYVSIIGEFICYRCR